MDASTSKGGGAKKRKNSAVKDSDSEATEFCPGFKDVDAFVKVSGGFRVVLFQALLQRQLSGCKKNSQQRGELWACCANE